MPFPDGTGMADETFSTSQAQNAAAMRGGQIPQHGGGGAVQQPGEGYQPPPEGDPGLGMPSFGAHPDAVNPHAASGGPQLPAHLSMPGEAFVPAPTEAFDDHGNGVTLAGLQPDGQVDLAAGVGATVQPPGFGGDWASRPDTASLHLSAAAVAEPEADEFVPLLQLAEDKKIKCPECDHVQKIAGSKKCANCGHDLSSAIKAKMANLSAEREGGSADDGEGTDGVHLAVIFQQHPGMDLAIEKDGGLVQKVICVTGTLALSPGPGQIDVEKPLQLTPDMFMSIKEGFDEQAFPHVTVPETHQNGALENTGYVRQLEVKGVRDPSLPEDIKLAYKDWPDDTQLMLAGIEFTEPQVRQKALNGSIPDTSVGVKFNYRNKRSGKQYTAALEHVALTPVPWVDGLTPFGNTLLSQQPYDQDEVADENNFDGVFIDTPEGIELSFKKGGPAGGKPYLKNQGVPKSSDIAGGKGGTAGGKPVINDMPGLLAALHKHKDKKHDHPIAQHIIKAAKKLNKEKSLPPQWRQHGINASAAVADETGDILSSEDGDDTLPDTVSHTGDHMPTVEELLAQQQARQEAHDQEIADLKARLEQAGTQLSAATTTLGETRVREEVSKMEGQLPPSVLQRVEAVKLAAVRSAGSDEGLHLSVSQPKSGGADGETEEVKIDLSNPQAVVDYLIEGMPTVGNSEVSRMLQLSQSLDASASSAQSAEARAKAAVDAFEKEKHPERFDENGKRKTATAA